MLVSTPTTASPQALAAAADWKMESLATNPAVGGTPASDSMKMAMAKASQGRRLASPEKREMSQAPSALASGFGSLRSRTARTEKAPMTVKA